MCSSANKSYQILPDAVDKNKRRQGHPFNAMNGLKYFLKKLKHCLMGECSRLHILQEADLSYKKTTYPKRRLLILQEDHIFLQEAYQFLQKHNLSYKKIAYITRRLHIL